MVNKQPMSLTFSYHNQERFPLRFHRHIDHTKHKVYFSFQVFLGLISVSTIHLQQKCLFLQTLQMMH